MQATAPALLFALLRHALGEAAEEPIAPTDEELAEVCRLAAAHDLLHMAFVGIGRAGLSVPNGVREKLEQRQMLAVYRATRQDHELSRISAVLSEKEIPFMPLKGAVLRSYYPEPWMRTSCDIDVLVPRDRVEEALGALSEGLSYRREETSTHDVSLFSENGVHIELHFDLGEPEFRTVGLLTDIWSHTLADEAAPYHHRMTNEHFCLYHIYHMAKHLLGGGCGIKPLLDLYVIRHRMGYDEAALFALLEECGLLTLGRTAIALSEVWMEGKAHDAVTERLEEYILGGGVYGSEKQALAAHRAQKGGRLRQLLGKIFVPYVTLATLYPSLKKCKLLFPFYQVRRWFRLVFLRGKHTKQWFAANGAVTANEAAHTASLLSSLGLI